MLVLIILNFYRSHFGSSETHQGCHRFKNMTRKHFCCAPGCSSARREGGVQDNMGNKQFFLFCGGTRCERCRGLSSNRCNRCGNPRLLGGHKNSRGVIVKFFRYCGGDFCVHPQQSSPPQPVLCPMAITRGPSGIHFIPTQRCMLRRYGQM